MIQVFNKLTGFQKGVYRMCLSIPLGETRSYKWVAEGIERPYSARAVGNALNKNPYAPFVPCHRVIASDGSPGGYRGGLRKKMMGKHYHLIGIGGIGMGTLASLLLGQGHSVSGSDLKDSEWTRELRKRGVCVHIGHRTGNIARNADYVV